jgi:hypothetical protein
MYGLHNEIKLNDRCSSVWVNEGYCFFSEGATLHIYDIDEIKNKLALQAKHNIRTNDTIVSVKVNKNCNLQI